MSIASVRMGELTIGGGAPLTIIGGPCVIESREHTLRLGQSIADICRKERVGLIFKASFDKANRSSADSFRGPGLEAGLAILGDVRRELGVPVLSDIHEPSQAAAAGEVLDVVQIPAFLCRQTDLLTAAGRTGKCVNIKKGQFMSPDEMANAVGKVVATGNRAVLLTERGTFFGYNRLVNDMTAIERMKAFAPVVFDATHSCQLPGGAGTQSGGQRQYVGTLAKSALAAGADALFLEVHDRPDQARSDAATVYPLDKLADLLRTCRRVFEAVR